MNILPKKRWHVRTKDNIARVRRDEAAALEEEKKRIAKLELAESEARINFLRSKSGIPERTLTDTNEPEETSVAVSTSAGHIDLFADYKSHVKQTNKDLEKEQKEEKEKYEKQIGYLTYLGQDTNEALKLRSWYEVAPKRYNVGDSDVTEKDLKNKFTHDPLTLINALLPPEKHPLPTLKRTSERTPSERPLESIPKRIHAEINLHKTKKHKKEKKLKKNKKHKKEKKERHKKKKHVDNEELPDALQRKKEMLEKLRKERLRREATERKRQENLLAPADKQTVKEKTDVATPRVVQKYNSQFNPELAKQNLF